MKSRFDAQIFRGIFFIFVQAPADFVGSEVGLHFSNYQDTLFIFGRKSPQHVIFFTEL
jgi:hypothetical protein